VLAAPLHSLSLVSLSSVLMFPVPPNLSLHRITSLTYQTGCFPSKWCVFMTHLSAMLTWPLEVWISSLFPVVLSRSITSVRPALTSLNLVFESPVRSGLLVPSTLDHNHNQSFQIEKPQRTGPNRKRLVFCSLLRLQDQF